jgi:uncharacterized protein with ATP-grasp and redox domains
MQVKPPCIPCVEMQTRNTLAHRGADAGTVARVLHDVSRLVAVADWRESPADLSCIVYRTIEKYLPGDPYLAAKRNQNQAALVCYPRLKQIVAQAPDRLAAAVRVAATGNVIDLGIGVQFDLDREVRRILETPLPIDDTPAFELLLQRPQRILYVGDNAGEILFDRVLVEELLPRHEVTFVVRGGPVINDATMEDAETVGLTGIVPVITTGTNRIGAPWGHLSEECRRHYRRADLVISKGQGNYETLCSRNDHDIFFILRAKCHVIAQELKVDLLDLVVKHHRAYVSDGRSRTGPLPE